MRCRRLPAAKLPVLLSPSSGLSGAMASISVRSGAPGSPTHVSGSSSNGGGASGGASSGSGPVCRSRRNGLQDVDLNTFISEEMALHLDSTGAASAGGGGGTRKRNSTQCSDVITDSPTHKRNRMIWSAPAYMRGEGMVGGLAFKAKARRGGGGMDGLVWDMCRCTVTRTRMLRLKMKTRTESSRILVLVSFPSSYTTNHRSTIKNT